jgi:hypothetical protein
VVTLDRRAGLHVRAGRDAAWHRLVTLDDLDDPPSELLDLALALTRLRILIRLALRTVRRGRASGRVVRRRP